MLNKENENNNYMSELDKSRSWRHSEKIPNKSFRKAQLSIGQKIAVISNALVKFCILEGTTRML